jgi:hypothetical protein
MVAYTCNPSTWETREEDLEMEVSWVTQQDYVSKT